MEDEPYSMLSIEPYWNWNKKKQKEFENDTYSQLNHIGIEIDLTRNLSLKQ